MITDARAAASHDLARRQKRYFIAMAFRVLCVPAIILVSGWGRWVLLVAAVLLPWIAVVIANQADHRTPATLEPPPDAEPSTAPQLTIGESDIIEGETYDAPTEWPRQPDRDGPAYPGAA